MSTALFIAVTAVLIAWPFVVAGIAVCIQAAHDARRSRIVMVIWPVTGLFERWIRWWAVLGYRIGGWL